MISDDLLKLRIVRICNQFAAYAFSRFSITVVWKVVIALIAVSLRKSVKISLRRIWGWYISEKNDHGDGLSSDSLFHFTINSSRFKGLEI